MTEAEFKDAICELARWTGWLVHHDLPALDRRGNWRTHVQGDPGFPDLILLHPETGRLIAAELKTDKGKTTPAQDGWLTGFRKARVRAEVWRPSDWHEIETTLKQRA